MTLLLLPNPGTGELILMLLVVVAFVAFVAIKHLTKEEDEKRKWEQGKTDEEQIEGHAWTLSNGTLIINSTEAMLDYNDGNHAPWYKYRDLITTVAITNGVTRIGDYAFEDCCSLTSITIPNSVTTIGGLAFWDCRSLTSITIPNSVTTIGNGAFGFCSSLRNVVVLSTTPPSITSGTTINDTFSDLTLSSATLTVPQRSKPAYEAANGWKQFATIKEQ